jgi:hypothetical protein
MKIFLRIAAKRIQNNEAVSSRLSRLRDQVLENTSQCASLIADSGRNRLFEQGIHLYGSMPSESSLRRNGRKQGLGSRESENDRRICVI